MDVSTCWDSTSMMLIRAVNLRESIDKFCSMFTEAALFILTEVEWTKIQYLIDLVRLFNFFTSTIGKIYNVTLPYGLQIYDELFERIVESRRCLNAKVTRTPWVKLLVEGLDVVMKKLDQYYGKMYTNLGSYYAMGTLLNPNSKNTAFYEKYTWLNSDSRDWQSEFEEQFRELYRKYYQYEANNTERLCVVRERNMDPLALMLDRSRHLRASI
jgi:hypothetical protein